MLSAIATQLPDLTFNVLVLDDWSASGRAAWNSNGVPSQSALDDLGKFLVPGAHVHVAGLQDAAISEWSGLLEQFSIYPSSAQGPPSESSAHIIMGRLLAAAPSGTSCFLFVVDATAPSEFLASDLIARDSSCTVEMLSTGHREGKGRGLYDGSSKQDWVVAVSESLERCAKRVTSTEADGGAFGGVVFLAGISDESPLGSKAFERLTRFYQAMDVCAEQLKALIAGGSAPPPFWIVSEGFYQGQIRPEQAPLYGLGLCLFSSPWPLQARLVDVDSFSGSSALLADLLISCPRERHYQIDSIKGDIRLHRHMPIELQEVQSSLVAADSPVTYQCDVSKKACTPGQVRCLSDLHDHRYS